MATFYFDSSALTKRYVDEPGSEWIFHIADPEAGHDLYTATLSAPEVIAALTRRARGGHLDAILASRGVATFRHDWEHQYQAIAPNPSILRRSMDIAEFQGLRGCDAVHVATALLLHADRQLRGLPDLTFVSADRDQLSVVADLGLPTENPSLH